MKDYSQSQFRDPLTQRIVAFLTSIGLEVLPVKLNEETFLPGILVEQGKLLVDEDKLRHPGDLLHEAGHLALAPSQLRSKLGGEVVLPDVNMDAIEAQAIAWSYAASHHLGLDPKVVFHEEGYKGRSQQLLLNFTLGVFLGAQGLEDAGLTRVGDAGQYPEMIRWLRE